MDKLVAARYMTRFRCIAADCEDHCCGGWQVVVDWPAYLRLVDRLGATPEGKAEIEARMELEPPAERSPSRWATTRLVDDERCAFLEDCGLCSIQRRFGAEALPVGCALYPRNAGRIGERVELLGELSCPEVARLCLLGEDAMDVVRLDPAQGEPVVRRTLDESLPWGRHLGEIVRTVDELLAADDHSVASRLFAVAFWARRLGEFFRPSSEEIDTSRLARERLAVLDAGARAQLDRAFRGLDVDESLAARVVLEVLLAHRTGGPRISRLIDAALGSLGGREDPATLAASWAVRREALPAIVVARAERYVERYARNCWRKEWYVYSPSVLALAQSINVRIALLRLLVLGNPAAIAPADDEAAVLRRLDAVAVEVVCALARAIEHDKPLLGAITQALVDHEMLSVGHAATLLRW